MERTSVSWTALIFIVSFENECDVMFIFRRKNSVIKLLFGSVVPTFCRSSTGRATIHSKRKDFNFSFTLRSARLYSLVGP